MLQGYHQLSLAKESKKLFCFALDSGLYRYLRTPMGYSRLSHYFNRIVQKSLEDIEKVHIEIDDLLVEGIDSDEATETIRRVLQRCRDKNIKLARYKLQAGEQLDFAGVQLGGSDGFRPTQV